MRIIVIAVIAFSLATALATGTRAQPGPEEAPGGSGRGMMMHRGMDKEACDAMMESMREGDAELSQMVERMKAATGEAKVDAVAAVVEALVTHRRQSHARMRQMPHMMCGGMMMSQ